jgi:hypothetical protein
MYVCLCLHASKQSTKSIVWPRFWNGLRWTLWWKMNKILYCENCRINKYEEKNIHKTVFRSIYEMNYEALFNLNKFQRQILISATNLIGCDWINSDSSSFVAQSTAPAMWLMMWRRYGQNIPQCLCYWTFYGSVLTMCNLVRFNFDKYCGC